MHHYNQICIEETTRKKTTKTKNRKTKILEQNLTYITKIITELKNTMPHYTEICH